MNGTNFLARNSWRLTNKRLPDAFFSSLHCYIYNWINAFTYFFSYFVRLYLTDRYLKSIEFIEWQSVGRIADVSMLLIGQYFVVYVLLLFFVVDIYSSFVAKWTNNEKCEFFLYRKWCGRTYESGLNCRRKWVQSSFVTIQSGCGG